MVQLHILEAVLELFFLACPAANKRHKRQLINRAVPNLAVTTFLVGGSPLHPSFLFSSLHSVGRLEKIGRADEHADLGVDLAVECVSSSGVHIMSNCVGWASFKAASIARACAPEQKKKVLNRIPHHLSYFLGCRLPKKFMLCSLCRLTSGN